MATSEELDEAFALELQISLLCDDTYFSPTPTPRSRTPRSRTPRNQSTLLSDFALARELFEQDLKAVQQISFDKRLAASIRRAVVQDAEVIDLEVQGNEVFRNDLLLARQLQGDPDAPIPTGGPSGGPADRAKMPKLSQFMEPTGVGVGRSTAAAGTRGHRDLHCDVCTELFPDYEIVSLPCEHNYCRACLRKTFVNTLTGQSFPARCCGTIPTTLAAEVLNDAELEKYLHESVMHDATSGPEGRRRNCARSTCGKLLLPGWIREDVGLCLMCEGKTCMICGGVAHTAGECPRDEDTDRLFKLADGKKWQRCPKCGSIVDLAQGCFHMTCLCKHQFCYKCAAPWKTCKCPQADESYITGRATTNTAFASTSTATVARTLPAARKAEIDLEHRQQALRYSQGLNRRLEELKTLRRTRESQRDTVKVDREVWEEEEKIRRELIEEEKRRREEEKREERRVSELRGVFGGVLGWVSDNVTGKGKGKAKERSDEEEKLEGVVGRLVDWTMTAESNPTPPFNSRSTSIKQEKSAASRKRELSPTTRDRMAGLDV